MERRGRVFNQTEDDGFFTGAAQLDNPPFVNTAQVYDSNISQLTPLRTSARMIENQTHACDVDDIAWASRSIS
jgi:hypothetical protein